MIPSGRLRPAMTIRTRQLQPVRHGRTRRVAVRLKLWEELSLKPPAHPPREDNGALSERHRLQLQRRAIRQQEESRFLALEEREARGQIGRARSFRSDRRLGSD